MNPLLNEYQCHYIEAQKSAHEAIKQLNTFEEHFGHLTHNDQIQLFNQIIAEQVSALLRSAMHYLCFQNLG